MWRKRWKFKWYRNECKKLAQEQFKSIPEWVGNEIYWELCNGHWFDNTEKYYTYNAEALLEKSESWIQLDFERNHKIQAMRLNVGIAGNNNSRWIIVIS